MAREETHGMKAGAMGTQTHATLTLQTELTFKPLLIDIQEPHTEFVAIIQTES